MSLLAASCGEKIEPGTTAGESKPAVKARVAVADVSQQPFIYRAVGTVKARTASTLSSKLMGTVTSVKVRVGDIVKKGATLVTIDDEQVVAGLRQAEAALDVARRGLDAARSAYEAAKAGASLAGTTYKRYQQLMAEDSVSKQEFDEIAARYRQAASALKQAEAMVKVARFRVQQAEAGLTAAQARNRDITVRAPYDGIVAAKMIEVGDLASPGTPFLRLEKIGDFEVRVAVPEEYGRYVHTGQELSVHIPSLGLSGLSGKVRTISPAADQATRTFTAKVTLPPEKHIKSGLFARVDIPVGEAGILTLPRSALVKYGQLTGFYLVDEKQTARFRLVRTGRILGERMEVISGLKTGDHYVVQPPLEMEDGVKVEAQS
jgi:multidrug efflux pump subunit AcrA (membrane-fusion protein)